MTKRIVKLKQVHEDMVEDVEFAGRDWAQSLHDVSKSSRNYADWSVEQERVSWGVEGL